MKVWACFKRNKKVGEKEAGVSAVRTSSYSNHPFWQINSRVPMNLNNRVYSYLRESVPVIDVAICKIVRLCEGFHYETGSKGLDDEINSFFSRIKCRRKSNGDLFIYFNISCRFAYLWLSSG